MDYRSRQRAPNTSISLVNNSKLNVKSSQQQQTNINKSSVAIKHQFKRKQQEEQPTKSSSSTSISASSLINSENEDHNQLSSLLTSNSEQTNNSAISNTSSRQAMLAHSNVVKKLPNHHQQQQLMIMQQQKRQQAQVSANSRLINNNNNNNNLTTNKMNHNHHHHHLSSSSNHSSGNSTTNATKQQQQQLSSADNMTTSSSDQTLDDLQQLAHSYANHHRLTTAHSNVSASGQNRGSHLHQQHTKRTLLNGNNTSKHSSSSLTNNTRHFVDPSDELSGLGSSLLVEHKQQQQQHKQNSSSQSGSRFLLGVLFTISELLLFSVVLLWLYWSYQHDDGLAWQNDRKQQFNTHAALMLTGFIFMNGQAMLIYRSFQCCSKIYSKIMHTILFVLATSAISFGLILGFTAQENVGANNKPIMHFYSLHAWSGIATVGLFSLQFIFGFVSFIILLCCDHGTSKYRAALLPIHKTFGLIIFSLAVATCLTGLLQTARSRLSSKLGKVDYHELAESGIVINLIGAALICLAILMPYIIRNLDIKRPLSALGSTPLHRSIELDRRLMLSHLENMRI